MRLMEDDILNPLVNDRTLERFSSAESRTLRKSEGSVWPRLSAMVYWKEVEHSDDIWKKAMAKVAKRFLKPENARKILFLRESMPTLNFRY